MKAHNITPHFGRQLNIKKSIEIASTNRLTELTQHKEALKKESENLNVTITGYQSPCSKETKGLNIEVRELLPKPTTLLERLKQAIQKPFMPKEELLLLDNSNITILERLNNVKENFSKTLEESQNDSLKKELVKNLITE